MASRLREFLTSRPKFFPILQNLRDLEIFKVLRLRDLLALKLRDFGRLQDVEIDQSFGLSTLKISSKVLKHKNLLNYRTRIRGGDRGDT